MKRMVSLMAAAALIAGVGATALAADSAGAPAFPPAARMSMGMGARGMGPGNGGARYDAMVAFNAEYFGLTADQVKALAGDGIGFGRLLPASRVAAEQNIGLLEAVEMATDETSYYEVSGLSLEVWKARLLAAKREYLEAQVPDLITREMADLRLERMEANQSDCDGTGPVGGPRAGMGRRGMGPGMGRGIRARWAPAGQVPGGNQ